MTDSTIDENGDFTGTEQSVNYMTQFQYYMFFLSFGGIMLKYYFIGFSGWFYFDAFSSEYQLVSII